MIKIAAIARRLGALLIHDCTYRQFAEGHTLAARLSEGITTYSFSKWLGAAGLRVGAAVARDRAAGGGPAQQSRLQRPVATRGAGRTGGAQRVVSRRATRAAAKPGRDQEGGRGHPGISSSGLSLERQLPGGRVHRGRHPARGAGRRHAGASHPDSPGQPSSHRDFRPPLHQGEHHGASEAWVDESAPCCPASPPRSAAATPRPTCFRVELTPPPSHVRCPKGGGDRIKRSDSTLRPTSALRSLIVAAAEIRHGREASSHPPPALSGHLPHMMGEGL